MRSFAVCDLAGLFAVGDAVPLNDYMVATTLSAFGRDDAVALAGRMAYACRCRWYALMNDGRGWVVVYVAEVL